MRVEPKGASACRSESGPRVPNARPSAATGRIRSRASNPGEGAERSLRSTLSVRVTDGSSAIEAPNHRVIHRCCRPLPTDCGRLPGGSAGTLVVGGRRAQAARTQSDHSQPAAQANARGDAPTSRQPRVRHVAASAVPAVRLASVPFRCAGAAARRGARRVGGAAEAGRLMSLRAAPKVPKRAARRMIHDPRPAARKGACRSASARR